MYSIVRILNSIIHSKNVPEVVPSHGKPSIGEIVLPLALSCVATEPANRDEAEIVRKILKYRPK